MTSDADGGDDPIKIEISKDNKYKRLFEKGLDTLLSNPNFLLLYVPKNGAKMQVIRPARDPCHRRRMIRRINEAEGIPSFYYALSHLWGITEDEWYYWNDIGEYVDDEDGQPVKPVSMRPEKRDTLLALLRDHPDSYWWIDVLCARTDTPLDIMGDIYSCCLECIAMIDCEPGLISQLHPMGVFKKEDFNTHYLKNIVAAIKCYDQCCQLTNILYTLIQSRWWKRVWTWQEMALPFGEVRLMAETGTHKPLSNTITVDELVSNYGGMLALERSIKDPYGDVLLWRRKEATAQTEMIVGAWCEETIAARTYNKDRLEGGKMYGKFLYLLLRTWGKCPRRCMDPVDYVYGVLGMLQIEIPRMDNPDAVWKLFLSEMDKLIDSLSMPLRISDHAYHVDLRKVQDMTGVYNDLLGVHRLRWLTRLMKALHLSKPRKH
ncbi:hypothetical protein O0I10_012363 [Lichtheimia ornata]|uniref:Heterokaryon incompatibility domain-containing protein n=1 Tax=Lichtheimia ornata TaxID=688661 RepID=A0AAD7USQ5_9FUNG|nr:uncharacterized protein O0I10_012363 [Lichtheimia ornata]KAJ8652019.1 hypothetical protein O0I10_012363 [Lichtheimia ornata]